MNDIIDILLKLILDKVFIIRARLLSIISNFNLLLVKYYKLVVFIV